MTVRVSSSIPTPVLSRSRRLAGRLSLAAVCAVGAAAFQPVLAQTAAAIQTTVPGVIRFDGMLPAGSGGAAGSVLVRAALYDAETGGTLLWDETQSVVVDALGRYTLYLGATRADGLPAAVLTGETSRWLGVSLAGSPETARVLLTSVPYALRASNADTLGGLPASAFLRAAGPDGTATSTDEAAGRPSARGAAPLVNSGTAGYLGKFTTTVDLGNSALFESTGRIGLGTTTPLDYLHSRFTDTSGSLTGLAVQNLGNSATSYSGMLFYDQNGALGQFQGFNNATHEYRINNIASGGSINFMLGSQSKFLVRSDGDVNIPGNLYKGQFTFLKAAGSGSVHSIGLGEQALGNAVGIGNIAIGGIALGGPAAGGARNLAVGYSTLYANAGTGNVALGYGALDASTGNFTIAIGDQAGNAKFGGNTYDIYIGASVGASGATESNTIRIGDTANYTRFFAGGIRGVTTGSANAVAVVIDSSGQLGTVNSSRRFKEDIRDMGDASSGLMKLRPVTYRYTQAYADGSKPIDYGLIAEEVAEVYPDLVVTSADGQIETVQYQKVNAMLLNEVQKQQRALDAQRREIDALVARLAVLERALASEKR
ncbi:MAG: tail fiber domain-containing protein [Vicinamibacterales bacterium]